jgi:hypothetical protein
MIFPSNTIVPDGFYIALTDEVRPRYGDRDRYLLPLKGAKEHIRLRERLEEVTGKSFSALPGRD